MTKQTIKNHDGQKIVVQVEKGKVPGKLAFVAHGLSGFKEQKHIQSFAEAFQESGYTVVRWDTRNALGESDGKNEDATFDSYCQDFEDVVAWAKEQPWYVEPFVVSGHSLGSYCAARYAELHPEQVKALAPIAVSVSGKLTHEAKRKTDPEQYEQWKRTGVLTRQSGSKPGTEIRVKWDLMETGLKHDLLPDANKLTMPVLLIVGEEDTSTPPETQKVFLNAIRAKRKELHVVPGVPHTPRSPEELKKFKELLAQWLQKVD